MAQQREVVASYLNVTAHVKRLTDTPQVLGDDKVQFLKNRDSLRYCAFYTATATTSNSIASTNTTGESTSAVSTSNKNSREFSEKVLDQVAEVSGVEAVETTEQQPKVAKSAAAVKKITFSEYQVYKTIC